ncbi:MAG: hypothetical protein H6865_00020 [Rhodospirillales bacterium]|nr:hypothetical protein [Alphaproteobacteria bacterium]MCB9986011.1 hypothetical protein [Rhodospirillales bacterium]USO07414.1 MAG: hypothetical protein H6866_08350 [Rhodospirillales bacterium]
MVTRRTILRAGLAVGAALTGIFAEAANFKIQDGIQAMHGCAIDPGVSALARRIPQLDFDFNSIKAATPGCRLGYRPR